MDKRTHAFYQSLMRRRHLPNNVELFTSSAPMRFLCPEYSVSQNALVIRPLGDVLVNHVTFYQLIELFLSFLLLVNFNYK